MPQGRRPAFSAFGPSDRILIVGAGPAGISAAQELRQQGFAGEVMIACDEPEAPYDRPACSKGLINGQQRPRDVAIPVDPDLDITWRRGALAVGCDLDDRVVEMDDGEEVAFDGLMIASGGRPHVPKNWPQEAGIHVLHSLEGAWQLRHDLRDARRVAIVGGGLTGCELATAVVDLAREAVLIDPKPYVMGRAIGELVGRMAAVEHQRYGVEMRLGSRVKEVDRWKGQWRLSLDDASSVDADLVVLTAGERPNTGWLKGTGIDVSDGVLCDEALRVLDEDGMVVEGVVAGGSLARWPNLRYGLEPTRCGQWIAAMEHGQGAARSLLLGDRAAPPVTLLPRFWSLQGKLRIQVCGDLDSNAEIGLTEMRPDRKDTARAGVLAGYHRQGRLVGLVAVNAPRPFTQTIRGMLVDQPELAAAPPRQRRAAETETTRPRQQYLAAV
jgi:NADPH-dependent 2,4-dienoyl-CoA reductase/sulfur reductase-like enzyme